MTGSHEARDFANRSGAALVLGGSGAVGAAVAGLLIERGSAVALSYRRDGLVPRRQGRHYGLDPSPGRLLQRAVHDGLPARELRGGAGQDGGDGDYRHGRSLAL
jgi:hypothetical protein